MHVLLVEDEHTLAAYIKRGLEEHGYAVDLASTGHEALEWTLTSEFDLVLLDVMLPGIDGLTVCQTLRERNLQTPVLMLTARDTVDDRVLGLDAGADDYLVKPFAMRELLARLRAITRRSDQLPRAPVLQVGDLSLDQRTREVRRGGVAVELTAKEVAILECLMRAPGYILSRAAIADRVWSYDVYHESNVVDVYIRNLRRKIDDPHAVKLIQTVRGAGYRLVANDVDTTTT